MANINSISTIFVNRVAQEMYVTQEFREDSVTPTRYRGSRTYLFKLVAGVIKVTDDISASLPDAQVGLKNALAGGGATNGLLPELNTYFTTNAGSILL